MLTVPVNPAPKTNNRGAEESSDVTHDTPEETGIVLSPPMEYARIFPEVFLIPRTYKEGSIFQSSPPIPSLLQMTKRPARVIAKTPSPPPESINDSASGSDGDPDDALLALPADGWSDDDVAEVDESMEVDPLPAPDDPRMVSFRRVAEAGGSLMQEMEVALSSPDPKEMARLGWRYVSTRLTFSGPVR
jgi:hypothetical protein